MDFEKLGAFYLGKEYDLISGQLLDRLLMYDARDLTTHAVCVGMTGSGKTGLCICLLEEAAIDKVPAVIIDPKGDMTNLLLTFPEMRPEDFLPWINVDDARRKGLGEGEFAAQQAELWRNGLAQWGQDGARIRMLLGSTEFVVYTPGSDAGVPVSILQSFAAPKLSWDTDAEWLRERIQGTVSALLGLIGIDVDPLRSREHILIANLFEYFWRRSEDLDLTKLILAIQDPPIRQLGVFGIDTFFPRKDRFELAMNLNNIIAAPSFQSWLGGQPLDVSGFLSTPSGKPRHSIFYLAHLNDRERMFFVTMLLNQVISWMRTQPGTTSLRAILYMDEIFGFFPPVANPPSKQPMLTLLKEARAFGLGVVLTTQNPVDLDYKGLSNAGTWLIGRLQTERDKMRLLDGLDSASSAVGQTLNRDALSRIVSSLNNRIFLLHNVHQNAPVIFQTRWAMSYLRGPLTRVQVHDLMDGRQPDPALVAQAGAGIAAGRQVAAAPTLKMVMGEPAKSPPSLPAEIPQAYLPVRRGATSAIQDIEKSESGPVEVQDHTLIYVPALLGMGHVHFFDRRLNVAEQQDFAILALPDNAGTVRWEEARSVDLTPRDLMSRFEPDSIFDFLPESLSEIRRFQALRGGLIDQIYRTRRLKLSYSTVLKTYSTPQESERDFVTRLSQSAREKRDGEVDEINKRYDKRLQMLEERLRRAEATAAGKKADAEARKREVAVSVGESVLGMFLGRRSTRAASTTLSKYRQRTSAQMGAEKAEEDVQAVQKDIEQLEAELKGEVSAVTARWDKAVESLDEVSLMPNRGDIKMDVFALGWAPHWQVRYRDRTGNTRTELLTAY